MDANRKPRPRLNFVARTARTQRIFERLREGWAYDEIASAERLSAERIRQIVTEALAHRVVDTGEDHAQLQIERLRPALKLACDSVKAGELRAIGPLIKVIDRLDRHHAGVVRTSIPYGEDFRARLLAKINAVADNLAGEEIAPGLDGEPAPQGAGPQDFFRSYSVSCC